MKKIEVKGFWKDDYKDARCKFSYTAAIGQYDGSFDDDNIFYWFDDESVIIGDHGDFVIESYEHLNEPIFVATAPQIGKEVYLGTQFDAPVEQQEFVNANEGKAFKILEVDEYTSKLEGVPFRVKHGDIYEITSLNNKPENEKMVLEEWEERIYKVTSIVEVDEDGNYLSKQKLFEEFVETTDSGENRLEDLTPDHWANKYLKPKDTYEDLLKTYVCDKIFSDYPLKKDLNGIHPFDYFLRKENVDVAFDVSQSSLGEDGFEVCLEYKLDNVRSLRGLMQAEFDDLQKLQEKINNLF